MGNMSLRGVNDQVRSRLKKEAVKSGVSVNALILGYIHKGVGLCPARRSRYTDLDQLAGTWTNDDMAEFMNATRGFEQIDDELWK